MPLMPGRPISMSATSGAAGPICAKAPSIVANFPVHSNPGVPPIRIERPSRSVRVSSTMATLMISGGDDGVAMVGCSIPSDAAAGHLHEYVGKGHPAAAGQRYRQGDRDAQAIAGGDIERTAEPGGSQTYIRETVSMILPGGVESLAVIAHRQPNVGALHQELNSRLRAARVANYVVHALLEYQEYLPPQIASQPRIVLAVGRGKAKIDAARSQGIGGKPAHPGCQIGQIIALRIDGPHDIVHGIQQVAREIPHGREWLRDRLIRARPADDLRQNRDLRKARADVVMEVVGDAH